MKGIFYVLIGVLCGILVAGAIYLVSRQPVGTPVALLPADTPAPLTVYVSGAVTNPGLYTLPPGSRVADAVAAAGGFLDEAARENINIAALLHDGQKIFVSTLGEQSSPGTGPDGMIMNPAYPLDLNIASIEDLETLPGIGPSLAKAIVTYREEHGGFNTLEELLDVPGIGDAKFDAVKEYLVVYPTS